MVFKWQYIVHRLLQPLTIKTDSSRRKKFLFCWKRCHIKSVFVFVIMYMNWSEKIANIDQKKLYSLRLVQSRWCIEITRQMRL